MNTSPQIKTNTAGNRLFRRVGQLLVSGGLLMLVVAGPLQPRVEAMRSAQGVYIPNEHYQFSDQEVSSKTKTLSHTFTLYNGRAQPLRIEATADCGCTGLSWQNATLPPFGREQITASMNSSSRSQSVGLTFKLSENKYAFASLKRKD